MVEVGDVHRPTAAAPADLDRLSERVEESVPEVVANVGVVDAAQARRFRQQRRELIGRGVGAGWVVEPAREAEGTVLHAFAEEPSLAVHGLRVGRQLIPADGRDAQRRVADQVGDVDAHAAVESVEVVADRAPVGLDVRAAVEAGVERQEVVQVALVRERRVAVAVDPDDLGRDALADLRLVPGLGEHRQPGVAVKVDEAWRHDQAGGVDDSSGLDGGRVAAGGSASARCLTGVRSADRGRIRSRSPMTATSAANPGEPLPSTTVPPWMSRSTDSVMLCMMRDPSRAGDLSVKPSVSTEACHPFSI